MIRKYNYIEWLKATHLQPRTIKEYEYCLDNLTKYDRLDQATVQKFIAKYKGNIARSFLRSYRNYLLRNPDALGIGQEHQYKIKFLDIPSIRNKPRKIPEVITKEEVIQIYNKLPDEETRLILLLSFFCGLRRETVLGLRVNMFNVKRWLAEPAGMGILKVVSKGGKQGIIPVTSKVMFKLYNYLPEDYEKKGEALLFPSMKPRTWARKLGRASIEAIGKRVKPHTLRHSIAMHLRGEGFELDMIKEFLMHSSISTTELYAHTTPAQLVERFKKL